MPVKYAEVLTDEQGAEYVAQELVFQNPLDPAKIGIKNGKPRLRLLTEAGHDAFAAAYGAIAFAYDIGAAEVTKQWTVDVAGLKAKVIARIDADAEAARLAFITPGSGQALVYQRKSDQAKACLTAYDAQNQPPAGTYPALEAEVGITGDDVVAVATVVSDLSDAWAAAADAIEPIRLGAKAQIEAAAITTPAQIQAILTAIAWPQPSA